MRGRNGITFATVLAVAVAIVPASAAAVSFSGPTNFGVGDDPFGVAVGQFNGSDLDLAVPNAASGDVSILLGAAGGSFGAATSFAADGGPRMVAVANFDGDSDLDLAVANRDTDNVSILLGDGNGAFVAAGTSPETAGNAPDSVAVGEFNGDSDPDLVLANEFDDTVSILLGAAGGDFAEAATSPEPAGEGAHTVAVGEFNGDSNPDLAVTNVDPGEVSILLGDGAGAFGAPTGFDVGEIPLRVVVGEFNGDSDPDLAVANAASDNVSILLGSTGGTFGAATNFAAGNGSGAVAVGEFNGDSDPDLAVTNNDSNDVSILLGAAGGSFGAATNFAVGEEPRGVAVGNFDGDSDSDLAVANNASGTVSILLLQAEPAIATQATAAATIGQSISDQATLAGGDSPTGTITFRAYDPGDAGCANPPAFTSAPVAVAGNGVYSSPAFTPAQPGTYRWIASYSGDLDNAAVAGACNAANETSTVAKQSPALTTDASDAAPFGGSVHDTATLAGGHVPGGEITFRLYSPGDADCSGTPVFTDTATVVGNGEYGTAAFNPLEAGAYRWIASYTGDANNEASAGACGDPSEISTVAAGFEITAVERNLRRGTATLAVETNSAGRLRVHKTNKVKYSELVRLDAPGTAELEVVPQRKAARRLDRRGRLKVDVHVVFAPQAADRLDEHLDLKLRSKSRARPPGV